LSCCKWLAPPKTQVKPALGLLEGKGDKEL
jgi:hypothetical protein